MDQEKHFLREKTRVTVMTLSLVGSAYKMHILYNAISVGVYQAVLQSDVEV